MGPDIILWILVCLFSVVVSSPAPLSKRYQLNLTGFNNAALRQQFSDDIDTVINLAQLVVDNINANHAIYLRFFGSPEHYNDVMNVYRRIANIRTTNNNQIIEFQFTGQNGQQVNDAFTGQTAIAQAQYVGPSHTDPNAHPRVVLYNQYNNNGIQGDFNFVYMTTNMPNFLDRARVTRQAVLFHELAHWAGDQTLFGNVLTGQGAQIVGHYATIPNEVLDLYVQYAAGADDEQFLQDQGIGYIARAYGETNVLALAQLNAGALYAPLNADTYMMMALAAFLNWSPRFIPPTNKKPPNYDNSDFDDPYRDTAPPKYGSSQTQKSVAQTWIMWNRLKDAAGL